MEQELNIAAILRDKPYAKLWSPIIGVCELNHINSSSDINVTIKAGIYYNGSAIYSMTFNSRGKYGGEFKDNTIERECMLFPSKEMRDWNKFAWKKGDVLISKDTDSLCVFDSFEDDTYSTFNAKYYHNPLDSINLGVISRATEPFTKVDDDEAKNFIRKIGEHYGGKLNLSTLEIEKPQFKPLDYVLLRLKNWEEPQWQLFQYAYETDGSIHIVGSAYGFVKYNTEVLPYNDKTAYLLGTTDDWEGGEE